MKKTKLTPLEKEWIKAESQELTFLQKKSEKTDSKFSQFLESKIPAGLQNTLDKAFAKAFQMVFEKGTGVIEKTYNKEEMKKKYQINEYAAKVYGNKKSLKVFSGKAKGAGAGNLLLSGTAGVGLGVLGIGLPDIALFTGLMLKGIYEIALHYGFDYDDDEEKKFILLLICGALSYGKELQDINEEINFYMDYGAYVKKRSMEDAVALATGCLSGELLYMKFLQGIPVVGAVGGAYDAIYMKQIMEYAELKYRRRFYLRQKRSGNAVENIHRRGNL